MPLKSKALALSIKHLLFQLRDWRQSICKFRVLFREADAHRITGPEA